jgi:hypothetical protein
MIAEVRITAPDGEVMTNRTAITARGEVTVTVPIARPQLWWPNGMVTVSSRCIKST